MTIEKATRLQAIQNLRHEALLKVIGVLSELESAENEIEGGDGEDAKNWLVEQLQDDE